MKATELKEKLADASDTNEILHVLTEAIVSLVEEEVQARDQHLQEVAANVDEVKAALADLREVAPPGTTELNDSFVSVSLLAETGFPTIESHGFRVEALLMNPRTYIYFRKFGRDVLDIETRMGLLKRGLHGYIWGAMIIMDKSMPENTITFVGEMGDERVKYIHTYNP